MGQFIDVADVAKWLAVDEADLDADQCNMAIDALEAHAATHYDLTDRNPTDPQPMVSWEIEAPDFFLGQVMAIARLRKRAEAPGGTISFDGFNAAILTYDGDIARLVSDRELVRFG